MDTRLIEIEWIISRLGQYKTRSKMPERFCMEFWERVWDITNPDERQELDLQKYIDTFQETLWQIYDDRMSSFS